MTEYKMTPEYCKVLTEMIGEPIKGNGDVYNCIARTWTPSHEIKTSTFTTDTDMMKVFRWLVDNGKWEDFWIYASGYGNSSFSPHEFTAWLFCDSERFNILVAMSKLEGVI